MDIKLIAHSAIRITTEEGKVIYFDPFKLSSDYKSDADIIFITHSHYDHFSPNDIDKIKKDDTKIVITKDLYDKTISCGFDKENILKVLPNNEYELNRIKFRTIPAYNINKEFHKKEYEWVGYIIEVDENTVYVAGDTDATFEAENVICDIALVPVGGTYTMTADEAAELIKKISPKKYAIPTHYQTIVGSKEDAERFKKLLENKIEVHIIM